MNTIQELKIVNCDSLIVFESTVNQKIKEGYQPYGNVEIKGEHQYTTYYLPMVKYQESILNFKNNIYSISPSNTNIRLTNQEVSNRLQDIEDNTSPLDRE